MGGHDGPTCGSDVGKKDRAIKSSDWMARAVPVIRDELIDTYRARARRGDEIVEQVRAQGLLSGLRSPLYNPDFVESTNDELRRDADALARSDLYWVSAPMAALAAEYADSEAPWRRTWRPRPRSGSCSSRTTR